MVILCPRKERQRARQCQVSQGCISLGTATLLCQRCNMQILLKYEALKLWKSRKNRCKEEYSGTVKILRRDIPLQRSDIVLHSYLVLVMHLLFVTNFWEQCPYKMHIGGLSGQFGIHHSITAEHTEAFSLLCAVATVKLTSSKEKGSHRSGHLRRVSLSAMPALATGT